MEITFYFVEVSYDRNVSAFHAFAPLSVTDTTIVPTTYPETVRRNSVHGIRGPV